jgi:hypothetical protein
MIFNKIGIECLEMNREAKGIVQYLSRGLAQGPDMAQKRDNGPLRQEAWRVATAGRLGARQRGVGQRPETKHIY